LVGTSFINGGKIENYNKQQRRREMKRKRNKEMVVLRGKMQKNSIIIEFKRRWRLNKYNNITQ